MRKKQALGQNFLVDDIVVDQILCSANIQPDELVVEIGPGKGALTGYLVQQAQTLKALELDPKLVALLKKRFGNDPKFYLIQADALKYDFSALGPRFKVVSNLPYYAATPILKRLIHYRSHISEMVLMLQKEVADRLTAEPGSKDYGSLSVYVQYYCDVEPVLNVDKTSFSPAPKVDSAVVRVTPLKQPRVTVNNEKTFFNIVNAAFFHKRKMLKNNFKHWNQQFVTHQDKIELAGIDLSRRGETLSQKEFAAISDFIDTCDA